LDDERVPLNDYTETPLGHLRAKAATEEKFWKLPEAEVQKMWAALSVEDAELDILDVYAVLQYVYEARNILSIWDDMFKARE
jgi:hypothetical protein